MSKNIKNFVLPSRISTAAPDVVDWSAYPADHGSQLWFGKETFRIVVLNEDLSKIIALPRAGQFIKIDDRIAFVIFTSKNNPDNPTLTPTPDYRWECTGIFIPKKISISFEVDRP